MDMHSRLRGIHVEKDLNLSITQCNLVFAKYTGLDSKEKVLGKNDYDFCWAEYAPQYEKHEADALSGNHYSTIIPVKDYKGDLLLFIHTKVSKKDEKGNVTGLICHAAEIFDPNMHELIQMLAKPHDEKNPVYTLNKKNPHLHLSQREEQCLFYLVYGKTAKVISKLLGLSPRTIEFYIENIKSKLGCLTKMELIDKAINQGYLKNIPSSSNPLSLIRSLKI